MRLVATKTKPNDIERHCVVVVMRLNAVPACATAHPATRARLRHQPPISERVINGSVCVQDLLRFCFQKPRAPMFELRVLRTTMTISNWCCVLAMTRSRAVLSTACTMELPRQAPKNDSVSYVNEGHWRLRDWTESLSLHNRRRSDATMQGLHERASSDRRDEAGRRLDDRGAGAGESLTRSARR